MDASIARITGGVMSTKTKSAFRIYIACAAVIAAVLILFCTGHYEKPLDFRIIRFFISHKPILFYFCAVNLVTFVIYGIDKQCAIHNKRRIRVGTLLGLAFVGGAIGALLGMYLFRHKTKKLSFTVGVPVLLLMQVLVVLYCMNAKW